MKKHIIVGIIALLIIVLGFVAFSPKGTVTTQPTQTSERSGGTTNLDSLTLGATLGNSGINTSVTSGTCNTGTSTLFAVKPPIGATSTMTRFIISGTGSATTTDIVVGTSTTPGLAFTAATTTIAENIIGLAGIATSTSFYGVAGASIGPGTGYFGLKSALSGLSGVSYVTNANVVVGPNEYILGFATSSYVGTYTGGITASTIPTPTSCFYSIEWQR